MDSIEINMPMVNARVYYMYGGSRVEIKYVSAIHIEPQRIEIEITPPASMLENRGLFMQERRITLDGVDVHFDTGAIVINANLAGAV